MNKAFARLGHQVINVDYRKHRNELRSVVEALPYHDVVLVQQGDYLPPELLSALTKPRFMWATELMARAKHQARLASSTIFKHIFVRTEECARRVVEHGWMPQASVEILLSAFDEETHVGAHSVAKDIDLLFVGAITARRRRLLDRVSRYFKVTEARAYGVEMSKLFARSKIVLNIHAEEYSDTETRIFEVLGSGGFLITEWLSKENPFLNGVHLVETDVTVGLEDKISYYLTHSAERERIAEEGYVEAIKKHTYTKRAEQILSVMEKALAHEPNGDRVLDATLLKRYSDREGLIRVKLGAERFKDRVDNKLRSMLMK